MLDAVSNAVSLTLRAAALWSIIIGASWAVIEVAIWWYSPLWRGRDGSKHRIKRLGRQPRLGIVGAIILLWIPQAIAWWHRPPAKTSPTTSASAAKKVEKEESAPQADVLTKSHNDQTKKGESPAKSATHEKTPVADREKSNPAPTQTMINSPGAIQAGGNVTISSDRHLIHSMTLRVTIETTTPSTAPNEAGTDAGLQSIIGLFTKDKTRIRFATNFTLQDQQVSETNRRLTFTYTPETPEEILGKPVEHLSLIDVLAVNYSEIFQIKKFDTALTPSVFQCAISVNGILVGSLKTDVPPGTFTKGQANLVVAPAFEGIPARYENAVARR